MAALPRAVDAGTTSVSGVAVVRTADEAAPLLDRMRRRILQALDQPDSAAGLARKLGVPRQKLNYHLRTLERARLVELVEERRRGNCTERIVRAVARAYVISPEVLGQLGDNPDAAMDRLSSSTLVAAGAAMIRDVASARARAHSAGKRIATLTMHTDIRFASAESRNRFAEDLTRAISELAARYHDDGATGGRRFRLLVGCYPAVASPSHQER
jgi:DNA-binding transcriptional ArsR family regulator